MYLVLVAFIILVVGWTFFAIGVVNIIYASWAYINKQEGSWGAGAVARAFLHGAAFAVWWVCIFYIFPALATVLFLH